MRRRRLPLSLALGALAAVAAACETGGDPPRPTAPTATRASGGGAAIDPIDPESCRGCHEEHVTAWSGSMHAYASDDPVFLAMNARGQRETSGALGDFCVRCHAPMAFAAGATRDGSELARLPKKLRGVTCSFCHSVAATEGAHDGALRLATDGVFRGGILTPVTNDAHASSYSPLHDRGRPESAALCGACHDVRSAAGVDLERTYAEWQTTVFAHGNDAERRTCGGCHMPAREGQAASVPDAPPRVVHDHAMAALDVALTTFPETVAQKKAVQLSLDSALSAKLCVLAPGAIDATLENTRIGHAWPTGAVHDRRAWLELVAFQAGTRVWSIGALAGDAPPDPLVEPTAVLLGGTLLDARGASVRFLWEAASTGGRVLPPKVSDDPGGTQPLVARFSAPPQIDRVTMRVRVTPFAPDVLDALVTSGDLDPSLRARVPVFSLATTTLEWTKDRGYACLR